MRKIAIFIALIALSICSKAQVWSQVGNTLQRQTNGTYSNYRFNLGSSGFAYFYSKPQVDSIITNSATYTAGYGLGLNAFQFRLDSTVAVNKTFFNSVIGTATLNRINARIPYIGATTDVDLGSHNITTTGSGLFNNYVQSRNFNIYSSSTGGTASITFGPGGITGFKAQYLQDKNGTFAYLDDITSALTGYVPVSRTITIFGATQDLSANRTFTASNLTNGYGISAFSYNGSTAIAPRIDTTLIQTVSNFFPKGNTIWLKKTDTASMLSSYIRYPVGAIHLSTISALQSYSGAAANIIVTDTVRGGVFSYFPSVSTYDNGITFQATGKGTGAWVRQYTGYVHVKWFNGTFDGIADNYTILQSILSKYKLIYFDAGNYCVNAATAYPNGLVPRDSSVITGAGMDQVKITQRGVVNGNTTTYFWLFNLCSKSYITITDIGLWGENTTTAGMALGSAPAGVFICGTGGYNKVSRIQANYFYGCGIQDFSSNGNNEISNCVAIGSSFDGINPCGPKDKVFDNVSLNNGTGGIEAANYGAIISRNRCEGNKVVGMSIGGYAGTLNPGEGQSNIISNNICINNVGDGFQISSGTRKSVFSNNISTGNGGFGINMADGANAVIDNDIIDNHISNNQGTGIYVSASNNRIARNFVGNDASGGTYTQSQGIVLNGTSANNSSITGNYSYNNSSSDYILSNATGLFFNNNDPRSKISSSTGVTLVGSGDAATDIAASYTIKPTDVFVRVSTNSARTITLCAASAYPPNRMLYIVDYTGSGASFNTITINAAGSDLINGAASIQVKIQRGGVWLESNGVNGWVVKSYTPGYTNIQNISANYTVTGNDDVIRVTGASPVTVTLPTLATYYDKTFTIQNASSAAVTISSASNISLYGTIITSIPVNSTLIIQGNPYSGQWSGINLIYNNPMTTNGDMIYQSSGVPSRLAGPGSASVLTYSGSTPSWSSALSAQLGGTGFTSYTIGDILYASGTGSLTKVGIGASGSILTSSGSSPQWSSNILPIHGNSTTTGSATTSVTVTIGSTMANTNYYVNISPQDLATAVNWYVSAKSTTTFTITFISGITGSINFDWTVIP